jgi:hypothetical protein
MEASHYQQKRKTVADSPGEYKQLLRNEAYLHGLAEGFLRGVGADFGMWIVD